MPDKKGSEQEMEKKRPFIREKVAKPPRTKRQMVMRVAVYVLFAIIAGAAAGAGYAVAGPLAERYLTPETTQPTRTVSIPTDADMTQAASTVPNRPAASGTALSAGDDSTGASLPAAGDSTGAVPPAAGDSTGAVSPATGESTETTPPTTEESTETPPETEPLENIVESAIEQYQYTVSDMNSMVSALRGVVQSTDSGIVVIHSVRRGLDWFDNPLETSGFFAGVVFASTEQELLILTTSAAIENADSLRVTFSDGTEAYCIVRQTDRVTGMAVVSVNLGELDEETLQKVLTIPLGNSFLAKQGDVVIGVGAPSGAVHSSAYGFISYVLKNVQVPDGVTRLMYIDMAGDAASGTFILNTSGEIIGWVTDDYDHQSGMSVVMGISDYKAALEKLSNGLPIPYLGVEGQSVSDSMMESGVPAGFYVAECLLDGPAYDSGIQNGDVITRIGDVEIRDLSDYQSQVYALHEGDQASVSVQRKGADGYIELEYQVIVGAR